jgi:F-type H+-transporting ATPase subunit b
MNEILAQLEINSTFYFQFALIAAFFFILTPLYLKPFQKLIEKRNQKLNGDVQSATELLRVVEQRLADYERELSTARTQARLEYEKATSEARTKEDAAIAAFKDELKKDYQKLNQQLQEDKTRVESELKSQVSQLADDVAQKILGK